MLYEDESCMVLNKPAGLAVQGGAGVGVSLDSMLSAAYTPRPLLVHRLDKDTSGVILVAKHREAAARFARLLGEARPAAPADAAEDGVIKRYLAVCAGRPAAPEGIISADLDIRGSVKKSETRYKTLAAAAGQCPCALLELELGTGRMHQIRRHLALAGSPVLGDDKYGDFALNRRLRATMGLRRLLLHAARLSIPPSRGVALTVTAPLPDYFTAFLEQAGLETGIIRH